MKKLFFALLLTGFVGAAAVTTVSATTHSKMVWSGGDGDSTKTAKKDAKCAKGESCCKSKTTATADTKCTKEESKKCCSSTATSTCTGKSTTTSTTSVPADAKKADAKK